MRLRATLFFLLLYPVDLILCTKDLYSILGVPRAASPSTIKNAYRQLVKKWHPDKHRDKDEAGKRFIEIQKAYEVLSDPNKRNQYNNHGVNDEGQQPPQRGFNNDFMHMFQYGGFGHHSFFEMPNQHNYFSKHKIDLKTYEKEMVPKSALKPYLIFVHAIWCFSCMRAEPIWQHVVEKLETIGYGVASVNSAVEGTLTDKLHITQLPSLLVLIDGRLIQYTELHLDAKSILDFARQSVPPHYVTLLSDRLNYETFLDAALQQNKMGVLVFGPNERPPLRFLLAAMKYHRYASVGYASTHSVSREIKTSLGISVLEEHLLMFNEFRQKPIVRLQERKLGAQDIDSAFEKNKFLSLPRISSQHHFDELCPAIDNHLCITLLIGRKMEAPNATDCVDTFRDFSIKQARKNVAFVYVRAADQPKFATSFAGSSGSSDSSLDAVTCRVYALTRVSRTHVKVRRASQNWDPANVKALNAGKSSAKINNSVEAVEMLLRHVKKRSINDGDSSATSDESLLIHVGELTDENGPTMYKRLASKLFRSFENARYQLSKHEVFPIISVLGTLLFILAIGWCLNMAVDKEKQCEDAKRKKRDKGKSFETTEEFKQLIREFNCETYFGMLRLLKPGCRTLIILCDKTSKDVLVKQFARCIWPWRKNHTLQFGYLMVEKNLPFFVTLLRKTMSDSEDQKAANQISEKTVNPRNVLGTVVALNGFRRHFCMYHPKYARSLAGYRNSDKRDPKPTVDDSVRRRKSNDVDRQRDHQNDDFLGLQRSDESSKSSGSGSDDLDDGRNETSDAKRLLAKKTLCVDELLLGLPNWLDRLFEGSTPRYHVGEWPESIR